MHLRNERVLKKNWTSETKSGRKEIADRIEISNNNKTFYKTLFKRNLKTNVDKREFLNFVSIKTTNEQSDQCGNEIRETDLFDSIKSTKNNKRILRNFL